MQWQSFSQFWAMDGYGLYIWSAYGVAALCMLVEPWLVIRRRRQALALAALSEEA